MEVIAMVRAVIVDDRREGQSQATVYPAQDLPLAGVRVVVDDGVARAARGFPANSDDIDRIAVGVVAQAVAAADASAVERAVSKDRFDRHADAAEPGEEAGERGADAGDEALGDCALRRYRQQAAGR